MTAAPADNPTPGPRARVVTRTGDDGTTGLFGSRRVPKDSPQVEAYGTLDELNAALGVVLAHQPSQRVAAVLRDLQHACYRLAAEVASDAEGRERLPGRIGPDDIRWIERQIDQVDRDLPPLDRFIVPAQTPAAAGLNWARVICRRAERRLWAWSRQESLESPVLVFVNRLSDLLFLLMRLEGRAADDSAD